MAAYKKPKGEPEKWITVNGNHIPVYKGQSNMDAIYWHSVNGNKPEEKKASKGSTEKKPAEKKQSDDKKQAEKKQVEETKRTIDKNNREKEKQLASAARADENSKYGPDTDDITVSAKEYFKDTSVPVNTSLAAWKKEADSKGIPDFVYDYMEDSSVNEVLRSGEPLSGEDKSLVSQMDTFCKSSSVPAGTILYSGLTSDDSVNFWSGKKGTQYPAFLSVSPDPVYSRSYGMNTDTVLQIETSKTTPIGKTYYEDSTGTEGVLGRNNRFEYVGESFQTINGDKVKIIRVRI